MHTYTYNSLFLSSDFGINYDSVMLLTGLFIRIVPDIISVTHFTWFHLKVICVSRGVNELFC